jgi:hypothetical protein
MRNKSYFVLKMMVVFVLGFCAIPVMGVDVTLNDAGLMSLDWHCWGESFSARVLSSRDVPGPGVEFEIYYPSNKKPDRDLYYVSSEQWGAGSLAGINISMYEKFELKFTLISVDGISTPETGGVLGVGALINFGSTHGYQPKGIDFLSRTPYSTTAISSTSTDADEISIIGFVAYIPASMADGWDPSGTTVTLLVEAAPGAVAIPEPTTLLLLSFGGLALLKKRRE